MIKYDLDRLGWYDFQNLCVTIMQEVLGQTVTNYLDTNDAGMDGAFAGIWKESEGEDLQGQFVIQCKFTNISNSNLKMSNLKDEFLKIERLVKNGRCDCYILMTNHGISGKFELEYEKNLKSLGVKSWRIFGKNWISNQITKSSRLRAMVPRVYGLGDLSQILDSRAYSQARQLLNSMREDLSKIVITSSYEQAVEAMSEHGFVLIIGEPAAGKTTIASLLAMAALDQWQFNTLKLDNPQAIIDHWNADDPSQFFWIDDAFGVTQYESNLVTKWNHILPQIKAMLNQGIKIVMTSRDYIYKRARNDLKDGAFPLLNESQVVIDLQKLSIKEREMILYNHLKLGRQNSSFLQKIKPFLQSLATNNNFIPEIARRLSDPFFTKKLSLNEEDLHEFIDKPEKLLEDVIKGLDNACKSALGLIYMNNGQLQSPASLNEIEQNTILMLGSNVGDCVLALDSMDGSLVRHSYSDDDAVWKFKHPTIADAFANLITKNPNLLEIFLIGTDTEKLMEQITCGNVGLEKTIIIPKSQYKNILKKINDFNHSSKFKTEFISKWQAETSIMSFLAKRCSKDFLKLYFDNDPDMYDKLVKPTPSFRYSYEINLIVKLNDHKILPERERLRFVDHICTYTLRGDDLEIFDDESLKSVFKDDELQELQDKVKIELLPEISSLRLDEQRNFNPEGAYTPDEHMDSFISNMNILLELFDNEYIKKDIEREIVYAQEWIDQTEYEDKIISERKLNVSNNQNTIVTSRSIFDDIDL